MSAISLLVRANDLGLCHAVNQAVAEGLEVGVLTSAALTVAGPWVAEAVDLVREHPNWEIGLQLSLTCSTLGCRWGPVAGPATVPSLVTPTGTFHRALPANASPDDIRGELHAQVERARAWGITPAYLESEEENQLPVAAVLQQLRRQLGLPPRMTAGGLAALTLAPDLVLEAREAAVLNALTALAAGAHLWVTHPAHDSPETWGLWPYATTQHRQGDLLAVCSAAVRALIRQRGIQLASYRQLLDARGRE
jgi:predicted glycoside hydrolase/deacetylase ChbG (UPF0249 family)